MLNRLANQYLKYGLHFIFIIKKLGISFKNLSRFCITLSVRDENCCRRPIDIIIGWNFRLGNKIILITQLFPIIDTRHLLHLHVLFLFFLSLTLSLPLLRQSPLSHFLLSLFHKGLFHPLLFYQSRVRLHIDRNNKCSKRVATNDTSIVHDVLRSHLTIIRKENH